jgi:hypothetical protein
VSHGCWHGGSVSTPEGLRSNSPQSKSQSQKSELEVDKEIEGDDKSKSDDLPPNQKLTSTNSFSSSEKPDLTQKRNLTVDQTNPGSTLPAWVREFTNPWIFLGIDYHRVPKRFRVDSDDSDSANFEIRFTMCWQKYCLNCVTIGEKPIAEEFAERVLEMCEEEDIEYPPILLKRKKELSAA